MTLPLQNFVDQVTVVTADWLNAIDAMYHGAVPAQGTYEAVFNFGAVQLSGPNGLQMAFGDFGFGLSLPAPDGSTIPGLLLGGATKSAAQIITDEQVVGQTGINLYIVAGETADASGIGVAGGKLWLFGGASSAGRGGDTQVQGGTSINNEAGDLILQGGNSTNGLPGNVYILGGVTGAGGGSVSLILTTIANQSGQVNIKNNSTMLWSWVASGAIFPGDGTTGCGVPGNALLSQGNNLPPIWGPPVAVQSGIAALSLSGATATIPTGNFNWATNGSYAALSTDADLLAIPTGPDDLILSTLPIEMWPADDRYVMCAMVVNNSGVGYFGRAHITPVGGVIISLGIISNGGSSISTLPGNFNTPGAKGINAGWSIVYPL